MNERVYNIINSPARIPFGAGLGIGIAIGLGVGYILDRKKTPQVINQNEIPRFNRLHPEELDEFIASERERLGIPDHVEEVEQLPEQDNKDEEDSNNPVDIGKEFVEQKLHAEPMTITPQAEETEVEPVARSVFAGTDSEWNYEKELSNRSSSEPYVIHKDEFYEQSTDYSQLTLTYYAGDDILVDEDDTPVYNHVQVVGPMQFGHGSGDPNVFHVRNDKRKAEYEILKDPGMYSKEVLGLDIENNARSADLRHSHTVPRFYSE